MPNSSSVALLPQTMNSGEGGVWVREPRPYQAGPACAHRWVYRPGLPGDVLEYQCQMCGVWADAQRLRYLGQIPAPMDLRTPHDRLEARITALEARVAELEQRLGSTTDKVVCCAEPYGSPCIRWTTRVNAEDNWAYVGAAYYCPQCWARMCAGRG